MFSSEVSVHLRSHGSCQACVSQHSEGERSSEPSHHQRCHGSCQAALSERDSERVKKRERERERERERQRERERESLSRFQRALGPLATASARWDRRAAPGVTMSPAHSRSRALLAPSACPHPIAAAALAPLKETAQQAGGIS